MSDEELVELGATEVCQDIIQRSGAKGTMPILAH